jgi:hypothetical protein
MPIPVASAVVAAIVARKPEMATDTATQATLEIIVDEVLKAVKEATVAVPGTGLIAPPNGGPVTGAATGTVT